VASDCFPEIFLSVASWKLPVCDAQVVPCCGPTLREPVLGEDPEGGFEIINRPAEVLPSVARRTVLISDP
jgi:hypothetical protein